MSKCISGQGEYSEHVPDDAEEFVCGRCYVVDEDAMRAEIQRLRADRPSVTDAARSAETTTATIEDKSVIERAATVITANTDEPMWSAVVIAKEMASRGLLATARTRPTREQIREALSAWDDADAYEAADAVLALLEGGGW